MIFRKILIVDGVVVNNYPTVPHLISFLQGEDLLQIINH